MNLLVTTSFSLLLVDAGTGASRRLATGDGLYYGLAPLGRSLFVAARRRTASSATLAEDERGVILIFDDRLQAREVWEAPFPLRDLHQIAWVGDELWATCSHDNLIAIRRPNGQWLEWYPLGEPQQEPRDVNHFNSLLVEPGRVAIIAHNLERASEILFFDRATRGLADRLTLGWQAHNLWVEGGEYRVCSSKVGKLVGTRGFSVETGGFPRGVARCDDEWFVGLSELAERKERDLTTGIIAVYDSQWRERRRFSLPGEGLVLDLMPVPGFVTVPAAT